MTERLSATATRVVARLAAEPVRVAGVLAAIALVVFHMLGVITLQGGDMVTIGAVLLGAVEAARLQVSPTRSD